MTGGILLTGGTGVLGSALTSRLGDRDVVMLGHRRKPTAGTSVVFGDVAQQRLGLTHDEYTRLCGTTTVVLHCASEVNFNVGRDMIDAVNVQGAQNIAQFGIDSGAHIVYVSTSFVHRAGTGSNASGAEVDPGVYTESKRKAESHLRESGVALSIARPSIVVGDSKTGLISSYQGLHKFLLATLSNRIPFIPAEAGWYVDMVPQDVVADVLLAVADGTLLPGDYWITAGAEAATVASLFDLLYDEARRSGFELAPMRILSPETIERLIRPAFFDEVPTDAVMRLENLTAMCQSLFTAEPFPSSMPHLGERLAIESRADTEMCWRLAIRTVIARMETARTAARAV